MHASSRDKPPFVVPPFPFLPQSLASPSPALPPAAAFPLHPSIRHPSSVSPPSDSFPPPSWSTVSVHLCRLSDELLFELLQFAGREWRLAAFNVRLLRDQLDALASAALSYFNNRLTWDELQSAAEAVLASLLAGTSGVQQFVGGKEAECMEALRQLTTNQQWRDAQQLFSHYSAGHMPDLPPPATDGNADTSSPSPPSSIMRGITPAGSLPGLPSSSYSALPPPPPPILLSAVLSFSPSMCVSFARVICDVHPRDAHRLLPATLYRLLMVDWQPSDESRQREQQQQQQQAVVRPLLVPPAVLDGSGSSVASTEYNLCRTVLSISRCLDHLLHFHLLHHLARFHLLAAFERALAPAGPLSGPLSSAHNALAVTPMANTDSLLALSTYLVSLMHALQFGHSGLLSDQQREHRSIRCAACHEPITVSYVALQCGHSVCYVCMLWRVRTAGATCVQCGLHNSMAHMRIDTLKTALTLTAVQQQQQHEAGREWMELPPPSQRPPATPPSPLTPMSVTAVVEPAMRDASAEPVVASDAGSAGLPVLGYGNLQLMGGVRREFTEETRPYKRAASHSLSHSSSTSSLSSSAFSSMSPPPSASPISPPRFLTNSHSRRSSVPNLLSYSGSSSSSSSTITAAGGPRRPLTRGRSRSARKLSDCIPSTAAAGAIMMAASNLPRHVPPSRIASPLTLTPVSSRSSSRNSPVPLMATVVEPPHDAYLPPVESRLSPSSLSSCHQCKSAKPRSSLMLCSSPAERTANRQRKCRKKYCNACLSRCYNWLFVQGATHWSCPACEGLCSCASCQRGRELRKVTEAAQAAGEDMAGEEDESESPAVKEEA